MKYFTFKLITFWALGLSTQIYGMETVEGTITIAFPIGTPLPDTCNPQLSRFKTLFEIDPEIEARVPPSTVDREKRLAEEILKNFQKRYATYARSMAFKDFGYSLGTTILPSLVTGALTTGAMRAFGYQDNQFAMGSIFGGITSTVSGSIGALLKSLRTIASNETYIHHDALKSLHERFVSESSIFMRILYTPSKPVVNVLMERYIVQKRLLPQYIRDKIEKGLWLFDSAPDKGAKQDTGIWEDSLNYIVNFPRDSRNLNFDEPTFTRLFAGYPQDLQDKFRTIGQSHKRRTTHKPGPNILPKKIIILWGGPGVGKTRAVGALAEVIGCSLSEVRLSGDGNSCISAGAIWGDGQWPIKDTGALPRAFSHPTGFSTQISADLRSKTNVPSRNPIVLFDEIDKLISLDSTLLTLLEGSTTTMDAGIIKDMDVSHALYVLNINADPESFRHATAATGDKQLASTWRALLNRAEVIHVPNIDTPKKRAIAKLETIPAYISGVKKTYDLTTDQETILTLKAASLEEASLETIIAEDTDSGMRSLQITIAELLEREFEDLIDGFVFANSSIPAIAAGATTLRSDEVAATVVGQDETESLLHSRQPARPASNTKGRTNTKND